MPKQKLNPAAWKLVAVDVDGTLILNTKGELRINSDLVRYMRKHKEDGYEFMD